MSYRKIKITITKYLIAFIVLSSITFTSCGRLKSRKTYIVATSPDNPPLEMVTNNNKITGFDIDLIKILSKKAGFDIKIIPVIKENLIYGLIDGTYSIVISGISFSTELKTKYPDVSFSIPYLSMGNVIVISEDFYNFKGLRDLFGKTVGYQEGSPVEKIFKKYPKIKTRQYNNISHAFTDLARNKISAVVVDLPVASQYVFYNDEYKGIFKIAGTPLTKKDYVIAVNKSNQNLLKQINSSILDLKNSGELNSLIQKWFFKK